LIKKDVVIAVLATFCLTSTLFMITTSKSQSGVGEYNPWADYNDDGLINILDIVPGAVSFGATSTDTTKNVNVTNFPSKGNLTLYTDTQTITVADSKGNEYRGQVITPGGAFGWDLIFYSYFTFSPRKEFNNVTRVIIEALIAADKNSVYGNFSFWIHDFDGYSGICLNANSYYGLSTEKTIYRFYVDDWWNQYLVPSNSGNTLLNSIKPGINIARIDAKLALGSSTFVTYTYKMQVLIEYTYWDYAE